MVIFCFFAGTFFSDMARFSCQSKHVSKEHT